MDRPGWAPEGVDLDRPTAARVYDYMLGGSHNFAVDREAARQTIAFMPDAAVRAQANRAFMYRAVTYLLDAGVRQFLDIGSGIPTVGNVHEVAQRIDPQARIVYMDIDAVAVAHSRAILAGNDHATVVQQDLRQPATILDHPQVRRLLDFDQPVALLLVAILHAIPDSDDPHRVVARLRDALAPGSYLVLSHLTSDSHAEEWEKILPIAEKVGYPLTLRTHTEIARFFTGFDLVEPGLVRLPLWRPEDKADIGDQPERSGSYGGVGRVP